MHAFRIMLLSCLSVAVPAARLLDDLVVDKGAPPVQPAAQPTKQ
jgi:hypothetical protein